MFAKINFIKSVFVKSIIKQKGIEGMMVVIDKWVEYSKQNGHFDKKYINNK